MANNPSDEQLLEELGAALAEADPVPDHVLAAAKAGYTWRTIDAELAELAFDSLVDELAGVRSEGGDRQLTFRSADLEIEVIVRGAAERTLIGQLVPPQPGAVELVAADESRRFDVGPDGTFTIADLPARPLRLRCSLAEGETIVTTPWLTL